MSVASFYDKMARDREEGESAETLGSSATTVAVSERVFVLVSLVAKRRHNRDLETRCVLAADVVGYTRLIPTLGISDSSGWATCGD
jgi:class 3 adenylate cyclase